jgi:hypothetical protein
LALAPITLDVLRSVLEGIGRTGCASRKVLSLGYPDILASPEHIRAIFGDAVASKLEFRSDSAAILRWHNAEAMTDRVADAKCLFALLGQELEVMDLVATRGGEIIQDLNDPVPEHMRERYAVVLDAGTLEHCFNVAQAAKNVAEMVALGGAVIHGNPLNMYNHGFYNLNPTWYHDFYETNGFAVEFLRLVTNPVFAPQVAEVPAFQRFRGIPDDSVLLVVARRAGLQTVRWPVQRKYRDNPTLSG